MHVSLFRNVLSVKSTKARVETDFLVDLSFQQSLGMSPKEREKIEEEEEGSMFKFQ